ncbi:MAG TPA: hypothetical protein VGS17_09875 [Candidatus Limnocylindria bacterium]|nr:hypothetical protein [Candidatus Limnocylindria bacterium]
MARFGDAWQVRWRIASDPPLRLTHVAAPHGQFRAADRDLELVTPAELVLKMTSAEAPGAEIENTFLIVTAEAGGRTWRILARMRVRVDGDGVPYPATERIDVQEVGFGGQR